MLLAIWDDGNWEAPAAVAIIVVVTYLVVMWVAATVWTYRDITSRTGDRFTHAISVGLVLVFSLPGLLLYLILRPKDTLADAYDRRLEAEALLHEIQDQPTCPACRRKIQDDFVACPFCRATLRTGCESCGKALASTWVMCPYCGAERASTARPRAIPAAAGPVPEPPMPARPRRASTAKYTPSAASKAPAPAPAVAPLAAPSDATPDAAP